MSDITRLRALVIDRILEGEGRASRADRHAAFDNIGVAQPLRTLVDKVTRHAYKVTDQDIDAVKGAGLSEDQIFEIVVCAAIGQATRQHDRALVALESALNTPRRGDASQGSR